MNVMILTPYTTTPEGITRPLAVHEYGLLSWLDVTNLPTTEMIPEPNLLVIQATVSAETLALIEADERFLILEAE